MSPESVKSLLSGVIEDSPFKIGDIVKHPSGRLVKIVSGEYWTEFGISNYWSWVRVNEGGTLSEQVEHGYGWYPPKQKREEKE